MARIGILTCSNCTQDTNCAAVVCLGDMRKRRGFFERYQNDEKLDLIGIINCSGCPTLAAPEKILKRVKALADYRLDALHFSYCMTALCPFLKKYQAGRWVLTVYVFISAGIVISIYLLATSLITKFNKTKIDEKF